MDSGWQEWSMAQGCGKALKKTLMWENGSLEKQMAMEFIRGLMVFFVFFLVFKCKCFIGDKYEG